MSTGDVAIAPAMLGMNPNADCSPRRAGLDASGAVSRVWMGKADMMCLSKENEVMQGIHPENADAPERWPLCARDDGASIT